MLDRATLRTFLQVVRGNGHLSGKSLPGRLFCFFFSFSASRKHKIWAEAFGLEVSKTNQNENDNP
jgi:hypothetical protein